VFLLFGLLLSAACSGGSGTSEQKNGPVPQLAQNNPVKSVDPNSPDRQTLQPQLAYFRTQLGPVGFSPRLQQELSQEIRSRSGFLDLVLENFRRHSEAGFVPLVSGSAPAWLAGPPTELSIALSLIESGVVLLSATENRAESRQLRLPALADGSLPGLVFAETAASGRYLALGCAATGSEQFSGYGLLLDLQQNTYLQIKFDGLPLAAVPGPDGSSLWIVRQGPDAGAQHLQLVLPDGRASPLPPDAAMIAAGYVDAVYIEESVSSSNPALLLRYHDGASLSHLVYDFGEGYERAVYREDLERAKFPPLPALLREGPLPDADAQELAGYIPVIEAERAAKDLSDAEPPVETSAAPESPFRPLVAALNPGRSGLAFQLPGYQLQLLDVLQSGTATLVAFNAESSVPDSSPEQKLSRALALFTLAVDGSAELSMLLDLPENWARSTEPVLFATENYLFILGRGYDAALYLSRLPLHESAAATWTIRIPELVQAASPQYSLQAMADGSCALLQSAYDIDSPSKLVYINPEGQLLWAKILDRPVELQGQRTLALPLMAAVNKQLQLFWPPIKPEGLDAAAGNIPAGLARTSWLLEFDLADGRTRSWKLTLPELPWLRLLPLASSSDGFAFFEPLRGRYVKLSGAGGAMVLHSFVLPEFITASQEGYDLQGLETRALQVQSGPGAALVWMGPAGLPDQLRLQGYMQWDDALEASQYGLLQESALQIPAGMARPFTLGTVAGLIFQPADALAGVRSGSIVAVGIPAAALGSAQAAATGALQQPGGEPEFMPRSEAYSHRLAVVRGLKIEAADGPELLPVTMSGPSPVTSFPLIPAGSDRD